MINLEQDFACPAQTLWQILGQPDRVDWVPGVAGCQLEGDVRAFSLPGAGALKERILDLNHEQMRIEYSCIESPVPFAEHLASMQVFATDTGCRLKWQTRVLPEKFEGFIQQSIASALLRLEEILSKGGA